MMARHRSLAGTVPIRRLSIKWPIFAARPYLAGARHNGAKRVDYDEADLSPGSMGAQRPLAARIVCFRAKDPGIQTWL